MAPRQKLVLEHLEDISGLVLEEYADIIRSMIRGRYGIYALYRGSSLYYVGLASNLMRRLKQHLRDRHAGKWSRFNVYLTVHTEHMKELESLLLRIIDPPGNKVRGNFSSSKGLGREMNKLMAEEDADRRSKLMGGRVRRQRQRLVAAKRKDSNSLRGAVDRKTRLLGWRNGWEYQAALTRDGIVKYDGEDFTSPSGAGRAALGQRINGWAFWHYRVGRGSWAPLSDLRG